MIDVDHGKLPLRVLVVNRGVFRVPPESSGGGAEKHGYYLANNLAALGHRVHFVTKTRSGSLYDSHVKVHAVPPRRGVIPPKTSFKGWVFKHVFGNILSLEISLRLILRERFRFNVIHCHSALTALFLSAIVGRKIPIVYTMHDSSPWIATYRGRVERWIRKAVYVGLEVPCLRHVDMVVAVSPALVTEAKRWKVSGTKVRYIPNGIEPNGSPSSVQSLARDVKQPLGLFVGQLVPRKGLDVLFEAITKLRNDDAKFLIVGEGPERGKLERLSQRVGITARVHFAGYVGQDRLDDYYSQASFFVYPSMAESFGFALFDAMSHGLPTVASDLKAYDGILRSGENSLLFEAGNSDELAIRMDELLQNPTLQSSLSNKGEMLVKQRFNWTEIASDVADTYFEVISERQHTPKNLPSEFSERSEPTISRITAQIAETIPAQSIYLLGSRAQHPSYGDDYDVVVVMKSALIPIYLHRIKTLAEELTTELGSKVVISPLPTFRIQRAKGNLFLMKNSRTAMLLRGQHVMKRMDTGNSDDISLDWYFSYYFFLLKELLAVFDTKRPQEKERIVLKISEGLEYLSTVSSPLIARIASDYAGKTRVLALKGIDWFETRNIMLALFAELMATTLQSEPNAIFKQVDTFLKRRKGKSQLKNFEYSALSFLKGELVRPDRIISRRLIIDRYRAALILLAAAPSINGVDSEMTSRAIQILKGCLSMTKSQSVQESWENLRSALFENWDTAQSLMGL